MIVNGLLITCFITLSVLGAWLWQDAEDRRKARKDAIENKKRARAAHRASYDSIIAVLEVTE